MIKWEYKTYETTGWISNEILLKFSKEGWELVAVICD